MKRKSYKYAVSTASGVFVTGDLASVEIIFNNFDGRNFVDRDGLTHDEWLEQMAHLFEVEPFKRGTAIKLTTPNGVLLRTSKIGAGLEKPVCEVAA